MIDSLKMSFLSENDGNMVSIYTILGSFFMFLEVLG